MAQEIFNMAAAFQEMNRDLKEAAPLKKGHEAISSGTPQEMLDLIDLSPAIEIDEYNAGMIFTDRSHLLDDVDVVSLNSVTVLRRMFANVRFSCFVVNPSCEFSNISGSADVLTREDMAAVIGFCMLEKDEIHQEDPAAVSLLAPLLRLALREDNIFGAYCIAMRLRELGVAMNSWLDSLLRCTLALKLDGLTSRLLESWEERSDTASGQLEVKLYKAACLTRLNNPQEALKVIDSLPKVDKVEALKTLQRGLAYAQMGNSNEAIKCFNRVIALDPNNIEARVARGVQTRNMHWQSMDEAGIESALNDFKHVINIGGYHSVEASFHAGTIYLGKSQMPDCEVMMRKVLQVEPNPVARRNLVLSLHAQGLVKEAYSEYQYLSKYDPSNAASLSKYFAAQ